MGMLATLAFAVTAAAQSSDALIDKLVDKGILTVKEAQELREESDKGFSQAFAVKSGMPEWVNSLKFNGDFRGRVEGFYGDNPAFVDRNRWRYRMRFGVTAILKDDFEVGLRLTSSEPNGNFGGDPISGNTTFQDNASKKYVYFDLAYAKWSPINTPTWSGAFTFGKMENPFVSPSTMVFDRDYTPEGLAGQLAYTFNEKHSAKLNGAAFVLDEVGSGSHDPWLFMGQLRYDSIWSPKISSSVGVSVLAISDTESLSNGNVPNVNRGNTRNAAGAPAFNFNPIYANAEITYTLEKFPGYSGAFPIGVIGDIIHNPAAPKANQGYTAGIHFGKTGKKGTWELAYRWEELQADAWYEELPESDFGAYYQQQLPNAGFSSTGNPLGAGYGSGTNVRGHWIKASYSPYDSLTMSIAFFLTELINESPSGSKSGMGRLQVDAVLKF